MGAGIVACGLKRRGSLARNAVLEKEIIVRLHAMVVIAALHSGIFHSSDTLKVKVCLSVGKKYAQKNQLALKILSQPTY